MTPPEDPTEPTRNDTSDEHVTPDRSTESREIPLDHDELAELARRRGLYFPAAEVHDGVAGFYTYGPTGAAIKRNVEAAWRDRFIVAENNHEIETPTIVPKSVFAASGHLNSFDDLLIACQTCDHRHRADHLVEHHTDIADAEHLSPGQIEDLISTHDLTCPDCGASLTDCPVGEFQLMFETGIGPGEGQPGYLRPETAQSTLVEFPRLAEYAHEETPFGVAQIGRGYRNEISPRQAMIRLRELTMAELQSFHTPTDDTPIDRVAEVDLRLYPAERQSEAADSAEPEYVETTVESAVAEDVVPSAWTAYYLGVAREWLGSVGVTPANLRFRQHRNTELAHYAEDCWDAEAEVDDDWIELAGIADRADNDLANHAEATEASFTLFQEYDEPQTAERARIDPDMSVLGPEFGDRAPAVVERLEALARTDPAAFEKQEVTIEVPVSALGDTKDTGATEQITLSTEHIDVGVERVTEHGEQVHPHVVEPAFGVDRVVYTILMHSLRSDVVDGEPRRYLALDPAVAPTLAAILPLTDALAEHARELAEACRQTGLPVEHDDSGSIGRRYRRQDEIGTPYCVTLDERTASDSTATIRHRDTTEQVRVSIEEIPALLRELQDGRRTFEDLQNRT
jgi:glycyl-tRNA synthetase